MNRYGVLAMRHWQQYAPTRYEALENPEEYFTDLGQQIEDQVWAIAEPLQRPILGQDIPYLEKVGAINATVRQGEEIVLEDLVYSAVTIEYSIAEELDQIIGELPTLMALEDGIRDLRDKIEEEGGLTTADQDAVLEQWSSLMSLLAPLEATGNPYDAAAVMSEAEQRDLLLKLRPFWDPEEHAMVKLPY